MRDFRPHLNINRNNADIRQPRFLRLLHISAPSVLFLCLMLPLISNAQLDNTYLQDKIRVNPNDSHQFGASLSVFNYMRNTEYFNKIELGRTLFGYQFNPRLYYQPNQFVKIEAGLFLRHDFGGDNPYTFAIPTFTLKTQMRSVQFLFGTLEGALSHRLIEPLFDISSAIENRIENGFQFKVDSKKLWADYWINWEKFIERGSPHKEKFTVGLSQYLTIFPSEKSNTYFIAQALMTHRGGQIDRDTVNSFQMEENAAVGLKHEHFFPGSVIDYFSVDGYAVAYTDLANSRPLPFKRGLGAFANLGIGHKYFRVILSYWNAENYIAPRGTALYQSVSIDDPSYFEGRRELYFLRLVYEKPLYEDLFFTARMEPVYDAGSGILDYSYSLYLSYRHDFNFKKKK